jgi:hypothetical protein
MFCGGTASRDEILFGSISSVADANRTVGEPAVAFLGSAVEGIIWSEAMGVPWE